MSRAGFKPVISLWETVHSGGHVTTVIGKLSTEEGKMLFLYDERCGRMVNMAAFYAEGTGFVSHP